MIVLCYVMTNVLSINAYILFLLSMKKEGHFANDNPWPWFLWTGSYVVECLYLTILHTPVILIAVNFIYAILSLTAFLMVFKGQLRSDRRPYKARRENKP